MNWTIGTDTSCEASYLIPNTLFKQSNHRILWWIHPLFCRSRDFTNTKIAPMSFMSHHFRYFQLLLNVVIDPIMLSFRFEVRTVTLFVGKTFQLGRIHSSQTSIRACSSMSIQSHIVQESKLKVVYILLLPRTHQGAF